MYSLMSDSDDPVVYVLENVEEINEQNPAATGENKEATQLQDACHTSSQKQHAVNSLSQKFFNYFEPDVTKINQKLNEVQQNQNVLIESLSHEKEKLGKCTHAGEVDAAMAQINKYRVKLCRIKKTMDSLKEHSTRLRADALRLQQIKQKENMKKEDVRHKVLAEERSLEAQLSPS